MSWIWFLGTLTVLSVGMTLFALWIFAVLRKRRWRKIFSRAHEVEKKVAQLLERKGYRVLGAQVEQEAFLRIDGRKVSYTVRADYVLQKGHRTYVAEVKTGNQVGNGISPQVRRQLLEYFLVYQPQAVLLVDGEREKIEEVVFFGAAKRLGGWGWMVLLFLLGIVVGQWVNRF